MTDPAAAPRPSPWVWAVCGMLLLATMLNYMDRLALNFTVKRVEADLGLSNRDYGFLETVFGLGFAVGAPVLGWLVDLGALRWLYPLVVLAWSAAGFATGYASGYWELVACRAVLGFAEGGHFPCALKITQALLDPGRRPLGNSLVQSGGAIGAVLTPPLVFALLPPLADGPVPGNWQPPFRVIGLLGLAWVVAWVMLTARMDLTPPPAGPATGGSMLGVWADRRFWVAAVLGITLNCTWHYFRAWGPKFLQEWPGGAYTEAETSRIGSAYYLIADAGTLTAGAVAAWLAARGLSPHASRVAVTAVCAALCASSLFMIGQPRGPLLLAVLFAVAFGSLGLFPMYYTVTQELSSRHQGKVTGSLSALIWLSVSGFQRLVGESVDRTGSHAAMLAVSGLLPAVGLLALWVGWPPPARPLKETGG